MVFVEICVGSSCHITGSEEIVSLFQTAVKDKNAEEDVILMGSFCRGKCNRQGVTVTVNDEVYTGITKENFDEFFKNKVLSRIED